MTTRYMLMRRGQYGAQYMPGTRPWRTYSWGATRRPLFKYVLTIMHCCLLTVNTHVMICMCYYLTLAAYPCHPCVYRIWFIKLVFISQVKNKPWHTSLYLILAPSRTITNISANKIVNWKNGKKGIKKELRWAQFDRKVRSTNYKLTLQRSRFSTSWPCHFNVNRLCTGEFPQNGLKLKLYPYQSMYTSAFIKFIISWRVYVGTESPPMYGVQN